MLRRCAFLMLALLVVGALAHAHPVEDQLGATAVYTIDRSVPEGWSSVGLPGGGSWVGKQLVDTPDGYYLATPLGKYLIVGLPPFELNVDVASIAGKYRWPLPSWYGQVILPVPLSWFVMYWR